MEEIDEERKKELRKLSETRAGGVIGDKKPKYRVLGMKKYSPKPSATPWFKNKPSAKSQG